MPGADIILYNTVGFSGGTILLGLGLVVFVGWLQQRGKP